MSRWGKSQWGDPFGAFDSESFAGVLDYKGFVGPNGERSRQFDNTSKRTLVEAGYFVEENGWNDVATIPSSPTFLVPIQGQHLLGKIYVKWVENNPRDADLDDVTYEIQWTDAYSSNGDWHWVARVLPSFSPTYIWDTSTIPHSGDAAIRIRAVDTSGNVSPWDVVSGLIIENKPPISPSLVSPGEFTEADSYINVVWDISEDPDPSGDQVTFVLEYLSPESDDWQNIVSDLNSSIRNYEWNISELSAVGDFSYSLGIRTVDIFGSSSERAIVRRIKITHPGNMLIDTKAPVGSIQIADGKEAVISREVKVNLTAEDAVSGVFGVSLGSMGDKGLIFGPIMPLMDTFWHRLDNVREGYNVVAIKFIDNAGNATILGATETFVRVFGNGTSAEGIAPFMDRAFVGFDGLLGGGGTLYDYTVMSTLREEFSESNVTLVQDAGGLVYIGLHNGSTARFVSYDGAVMTNILSSPGTATFVGMSIYAADIFAAMSDGRIFRVRAGIASLVHSGDPILSMATTYSGIYAMLDDPGYFLVYDELLDQWQKTLIPLI
jgi:hypothetical protein